jgi:hypothetical protein
MNAKSSYEKVEVLVRYFEAEAIRIAAAYPNLQNLDARCISTDYKNLVETY